MRQLISEHYIARKMACAKSFFMIFTLNLKWKESCAASVCSPMPFEHFTDVIDANMPL
jgi:hypothetical protein